MKNINVQRLRERVNQLWAEDDGEHILDLLRKYSGQDIKDTSIQSRARIIEGMENDLQSLTQDLNVAHATTINDLAPLDEISGTADEITDTVKHGAPLYDVTDGPVPMTRDDVLAIIERID